MANLTERQWRRRFASSLAVAVERTEATVSVASLFSLALRQQTHVMDSEVETAMGRRQSWTTRDDRQAAKETGRKEERKKGREGEKEMKRLRLGGRER